MTQSGSRRSLSFLTTLALLVTPIGPALADPPASLADRGDCGMDASQPRTFNHINGNTYEFRSFFEPGFRIALDRIGVEDLRALAAEVDRLAVTTTCYDVCVRSLVTGDGLNQAAAGCDLLFILAHGSETAPFVEPGGRSQHRLTSGPSSIRASGVWIGACQAPTAVSALNGPTGTRYRTMPPGSFDRDGTVGRRTMVQQLTAELSQLRDTQCEMPKKVCVVSGVQELVPQ